MANNAFKILGLLLSYPESALIECIDRLKDILTEEELVPKKYQKRLHAFLNRLKSTELLELQEQYVELFDRTPSLSLHLFEHVYGESRDRGKALVDLASRYHEKGLTIKRGELPDYLPLFLEFLSVLPLSEASSLLGEPINIIAVLGKRLNQRNSDYFVVFDILENLSTQKPNAKIVENTLQKTRKTKSISLEEAETGNLYLEWEEKPVQFMHPALQKN